jgi:hypothetical protein
LLPTATTKAAIRHSSRLAACGGSYIDRTTTSHPYTYAVESKKRRSLTIITINSLISSRGHYDLCPPPPSDGSAANHRSPSSVASPQPPLSSPAPQRAPTDPAAVRHTSQEDSYLGTTCRAARHSAQEGVEGTGYTAAFCRQERGLRTRRSPASAAEIRARGLGVRSGRADRWCRLRVSRCCRGPASRARRSCCSWKGWRVLTLRPGR